MLDEAAGWDDLVIGLRPATRGMKGKVYQSSCLRWCSESGEGIERRVASSPSPQQSNNSFISGSARGSHDSGGGDSSAVVGKLLIRSLEASTEAKRSKTIPMRLSRSAASSARSAFYRASWVSFSFFFIIL
jgi:hypothetical protein